MTSSLKEIYKCLLRWNGYISRFKKTDKFIDINVRFYTEKEVEFSMFVDLNHLCSIHNYQYQIDDGYSVMHVKASTAKELKMYVDNTIFRGNNDNKNQRHIQSLSEITGRSDKNKNLRHKKYK